MLPFILNRGVVFHDIPLKRRYSDIGCSDLEQRYLIFTGYAVEAYLMKNMDIHRLVRLKESIGGHILRFRFKPKPKIFR